MRADPRAYLWDIQESAQAIREFTHHKNYQAYLADHMLRSAVERQFEIIGEALNQLSKISPEVASRVPQLRAMIGFRNVLIHAYAVIDNAVVWKTIQEDIPQLQNHIAQLSAQLA
jgi:uncharacterized protein with HEPN domain